MKDAALERGTPVFQPDSVNVPQALGDLLALNADLCVVAAYGQILSAELLQLPRLGAVNVHASLLPKYRGAAPVQYAIWKGETETGITIFQIDPKLDAGPVLGVERTPIGPKETAGELEERLALLAAPLCVRVICEIEAGTTQPIPQDAAQVTRAPRLKKSAGAIGWSRSAEEIGWHVRAMQPWPKAFSFLSRAEGQPIRLIVLDVEPADVSADAPAGTVILADGSRLVVQTGSRALELVRVQPEGKRAMTAAEFLRGHPVQIGERMLPPATAE
jgi:methionyl-tRNA formyltransferase